MKISRGALLTLIWLRSTGTHQHTLAKQSAISDTAICRYLPRVRVGKVTRWPERVPRADSAAMLGAITGVSPETWLIFDDVDNTLQPIKE